MKSSSSFNCSVAVILIGCAQASLQGQPNRISGPVNDQTRIALRDNVLPNAQLRFDQGTVAPSVVLNYITLMLQPSVNQLTELDELLAKQNDARSPQYHKWLTPEQYADRFGLSPVDIRGISLWLESQGFGIHYASRGRNWVAFSGSAAQVTKAFGTEIHFYDVDGETHFANSSAPTIPAAFENLVLGIRGLDDFHPKASPLRAEQMFAAPELTLPSGVHSLVPDDVATIYDVKPLYQAGLDGSGQRVVVAGQSSVSAADLADFRLRYGLPAIAPEILLVPGSQDPGKTSEENEADLDVEWIGAIARKAVITYVYAPNALDAVQYAISQNLARIISFSFASCEKNVPAATGTFFRSQAQQANAQGITWLASSGDAGPANCDTAFASVQATHGLAVSFPASIPEVTAVGGTSFADQGNNWGANYWDTANSQTDASALSYIPENAWNDSGIADVLAASAGGLSALYPLPAWQVGPGLPSGSARAVPDVALAASVTSNSYLIVAEGKSLLVGGTCRPHQCLPALLLSSINVSRGQGASNINPNLYRLAQTKAFHDIVRGDNVVRCSIGTADCESGFFGYTAGPGYDLVTGLGSVDANNLVTEWNAATPKSEVVSSCTPNPVDQQPTDAKGESWFYTILLTETAGVGTSLTGLSVNGVDQSSQIVTYFGTSTIAAGSTISGNLSSKTLPVAANMSFAFTGVDAGGRKWSSQLQVPFRGMQASTAPVIAAVVNSASYQPGISTGGLATLFGTHLSPVVGIEMPSGATSYKEVSVTVGGRLAPLFSVVNVNGQEQINFQVPTELAAPGSLPIQINRTGSIATLNGISITPAQPGIFEYTPVGTSTSYAVMFKPDGSIVGPSNPASRGTTLSMYVTGLGPASPYLATGQSGPTPPATTNIEPVVTFNQSPVLVEFSGPARLHRPGTN